MEWFEGSKADFAEVRVTFSVFRRFSTNILILSTRLLFKITFDGLVKNHTVLFL